MGLKSLIDAIMRIFGYTHKQEQADNSDYLQTRKISFTNIIAKKVANKALCDSKFEVLGTTDRAKFLNSCLKYLSSNINTVITSMLGNGGVAVIPYMVDGEIYFNKVTQDKIIVEKIAGNKIKDCTIIADVYEEKGSAEKYYRNIRYFIENGKLNIINFATREDTPVPLSRVKEWADIPQQIVIDGVNSMPFAFFRCPIDSKGQNLQVKGVPITYGCDATIKELHELLDQIRYEYGEKEVKVFADSVLFDRDQKLARRYQKITGSGMGENQIDVYSPDIRDVSFYNRKTELLRQLEQEIGLNEGILTEYKGGDRTAYEVKANQGDTFALVYAIRAEIEKGIQEYVTACDFLANYYNLSKFGDFEIFFDWGNLLLEDANTSFNQIIQAQAIGSASKGEVRNFIFNKETIEESEAKVKEIEKNEPTLKQLIGVAE